MSSPHKTSPASTCFIIMGVSGSGKSTIGELLAIKLNMKFIDGDSLHPPPNIMKMSKSQPLTDDDRKPWLENINKVIHEFNKNNANAIVVCSALKQSYRNILRKNNNVQFIYLKCSFEVIVERLKQRTDHFMPIDLLQSQFDSLEEPDTSQETDILVIHQEGSTETTVHQCSETIKQYFYKS